MEHRRFLILWIFLLIFTSIFIIGTNLYYNQNYWIDGTYGIFSNLSSSIDSISSRTLSNRNGSDNTSTSWNAARISSPNCGYLFRRYWPHGRLGNQLFQYASIYGLIRETDRSQTSSRKIAFISHVPGELSKTIDSLPFVQLNDSESDRSLSNASIEILNESGSRTYDRSDSSKLKCDGRSLEMRGYRQNYKYFRDTFNELREIFLNFKPTIRDECESKWKNLTSVDGFDRKCSIVGIHLRRGDFVLKADLGQMPASLEYFQRAVTFFEDIYFSNLRKVDPKVECLLFLIFGNTYEWNLNASQNINISYPNLTRIELIDSSKSSASVDLCLLTKCDHVAMSTGTFGWWAGFLSRGIVTYQKEYENERFKTFYDPREFFLPNWIPL